MSRYRSEEDGLKARIAELEDLVQATREERDRLLGVINQGPRAKEPFSRLMYRLGRGLGRLFSKRPRREQEGVEALRAHVAALEAMLVTLTAAVEQAAAAEAEAKRQARARMHIDNP